jgi:hypothetical protein
LLSSLPVTAGTASFNLADTFFLHSDPTSTKTIHLDFDGHTTDVPEWNDGVPFTTPAFNFEGDNSSFTDNERTRIQAIWERVAEDYVPFDVAVTTEEPPLDWLTKDTATDPDDVHWGQRVVIGGNGSWLGEPAWGIAKMSGFASVTLSPRDYPLIVQL